MKPIRIRDLQIGEGKPKICVPILEKCVDDIQDAAMQIAHSCADLVEWRVDWFEDCLEKQAIRSVLETLRHTLGEIPILLLFAARRRVERRRLLMRHMQTYFCLFQKQSWWT